MIEHILITFLAVYLATLYFLPRYKSALQSEKINLLEKEIFHLSKRLKEREELLDRTLSQHERLTRLFFEVKINET